LIRHFARTNALRLLSITGFSALNAAAGFAAFSTIGLISAHAPSLLILAQTAILLLVLIGSALCTQSLAATLGADFVSALRISLADRLMTYSYSPSERGSTNELSAFINDIAEIAPLAMIAPIFSYNMLLIVVTTGYLFYISMPLAFLVLVQIIVLMALSMYLLRSINPTISRLRAADDQLFSSITSLMSGRKQLLINRRRTSHFREHVLSSAILTGKDAMAAAHMTIGRYNAWASCMFFIVVVSTTILSGSFTHASRETFASFIIGCIFLIGPSMFVVSSTQQVSRGFAAVRRIEKFSADNTPVYSHSLPTRELGWRTISLLDCEYRYDATNGQGAVVGPLNLSIRRGEMIFVVGENGSGKSTLLLILSGLISPSSGTIRIDERDMREVAESHRERLSILFSDFHIFDHLLDSAGDPVDAAFAHPEAARFGLEGVVEIKDGMLSRTEASAGQRKRLALLQLILEDRDILILDEAAADLDPQFKDYFYRTLLEEFRMKGKTIILATHDAEYFSLADRVLQMEGGQLLDSYASAP